MTGKVREAIPTDMDFRGPAWAWKSKDSAQGQSQRLVSTSQQRLQVELGYGARSQGVGNQRKSGLEQQREGYVSKSTDK